MAPFLHAHATHPDWRIAFALVAAQLDAQRPAREPFDATLGFVYYTDHYAAHAEALLAALQSRWPGVHWAGSVGVGVSASGVEYFDEPALVVMLGALPAEQLPRVLGGAAAAPAARRLQRAGARRPGTPDLAELIAEMSRRTGTGYLFGGLAAARIGRLAHRRRRLAGRAFGRGVHARRGRWSRA